MTPGDLVTYRKSLHTSQFVSSEFLFVITRFEGALFLLNKRGFMWSSIELYERI